MLNRIRAEFGSLMFDDFLIDVSQALKGGFET